MIEPLYILRPEVDMLSIEDIKRKIRVLEHGLLMSHGRCTNRRKRIAVLEDYLKIKNGIACIL